MENQKFGRLTVVKLNQIKLYTYKKNNRKFYKKFWECLCDCGTTKIVVANNLISGHTRSCGCLAKETASLTVSTHKMSKDRFYRIWANMNDRCGRGRNVYKNISVCNNWSDFMTFKEDMFDEYNRHVSTYGIKNTTIDRIDSTKNYSKDNCRWATYKTQANNTSANRPVKLNGKVQNISTWISDLKLNKSTVYYRLKKGLSIEDALKKG